MEKSMITEQIYNRKGMRFLICAAALVLILWGVNQAQSVVSIFLVSGFLAIIGIPPYFWLIKKRTPSWIAVLMVIAAMILVFLTIIFLIGLSIKNIIDSFPVYQVRLQDEFVKLKIITAKIGLSIDEKALLKYVSPEKLSSMGANLLSGLISILSSAVLILLTVSFVLLEATSFPKKLRTTIGDPKAVFPEFSKFVNEIKRFVLIQTAISLSTGIIAGVWLALLGVDFAVPFGLITFLFNYIPNVGSIISITPAIIVTIIQFGIERALIVLGGYLLITLITGSIIVPRIMGQRLGLSNLVVFLSLIFWGSLLGMIGMILCVPLTMALKFVLERSENTRWIATLLGRASKKENKPKK